MTLISNREGWAVNHKRVERPASKERVGSASHQSGKAAALGKPIGGKVSKRLYHIGGEVVISTCERQTNPRVYVMPVLMPAPSVLRQFDSRYFADQGKIFPDPLIQFPVPMFGNSINNCVRTAGYKGEKLDERLKFRR